MSVLCSSVSTSAKTQFLDSWKLQIYHCVEEAEQWCNRYYVVSFVINAVKNGV